jgi:hypothetical protein
MAYARDGTSFAVVGSMREVWALVVLCFGCAARSETEDACLVGLEREPLRTCFPTSLEPEANPESPRYGQVNCTFIVSGTAGTPFCDCTRQNYVPASDAQSELARDELRARGLCFGDCCENVCSCVLLQLSGDELTACQWPNEAESSPRGWCYVEPEAGWGDPSTVEDCPSNQQKLLRIVPESVMPNGTIGTLACID